MCVSKAEPSPLLCLVLHCQHMKEKDITNTELLVAIEANRKAIDTVVEKMATKDDLEETHRFISKGFTSVEESFQKVDERFDSLEQRLAMKIDGVRNSLDSEILRRTDEYGQIMKRLTTLENLHGIDHKKKEPIIV